MGGGRHAAAIYDRRAQRLSLYLDGKLDTADGSPAAENPVDISQIGVVQSQRGDPRQPGQRIPVYRLAGRGLAVSASALKKPAEFAIAQSYPSPFGSPNVTYPATGVYQSPPCDWCMPATLTGT